MDLEAAGGRRSREGGERGRGRFYVVWGVPEEVGGFQGVREGVPTIRERDAGGWSRIRMAEISGAPAGGQA